MECSIPSQDVLVSHGVRGLRLITDFVFISVVSYSKVTGNAEASMFGAQHSALNWPQSVITVCGATSTVNTLRIYIYIYIYIYI